MRPLERDRELELLRAAAAGAAAGDGSTVVIEGPAGIGKSVILGEARQAASGELRVLAARGGVLERDFAFGVVRQLLERAVVGREGLPDAALAVLGDATGAVEGSFAVLHGLFWTVLDLASEGPLMLAVDDLQWADRPSLRFLAYLARRIDEVPVLLVATVRSGEPEVDDELLAAVSQAPATVLRPAPLSAGAIETLLTERLGEPEAEFVDAACVATAGNPLLVRELAVALELEGERPVAARAEAVRTVGARGVARGVAVRLERLSDDARRVGQAVAVLGDGVTVADIGLLTELTVERVAAATGPLARADLLRTDPPLGFVHPLVAEAVLQTLAPGERELQHALAARVLRRAGAAPEVVAGHLLRAPRTGDPDVVAALEAAARTAMGRGAPDSAAALLRRALDEPPAPEARPDLLLDLGLAEAASQGAGAAEHLRAALAQATDPRRRLVAAAALGRTLLFTGDPGGAAAVALQVAGSASDDARDQLEAFAAMTAWFDDRAATAVEDTVALRSPVPSPTSGPGARMKAAVGSFGWANEPGPLDACVELATAALAGGALIDADNGLLNVPPAGVLAYAEHPDAVAHLEAALADAHRRGSLFAAAGARLWLGHFRRLRSELDDAVATGALAVEELRTWGFDNGPEYGTAFLVAALVEQGNLAAARAALEEGRPPTTLAEGARFWHQSHLALLTAEGRDEEALGVADHLAAGYAHVRNPMAADWLLDRAILRARGGDPDGARADVDTQLALARRWGAPGPIGKALRVAGELFGDDLTEAEPLLATSSMRLEHARVLLAIGRRVRLGRAPAQAREPLRRALEIASACGAAGVVKDARAELAAAGARPRTDALSGPASLTPSERRVAELAADGQTNREIAQRLFVTPKTVEVHLSATYRKLDIASRRELAAALGA